MNKAERARLLVKQTVEQEQSLEEQNRLFQQFIVQKLASHSQKSGTILQNQKTLKDSLKSHSGLLTLAREEISELMKEQVAMRKSQKRLQEIWILNFLFVTVPLLAFWVVFLVYWMVV